MKYLFEYKVLNPITGYHSERKKKEIYAANIYEACALLGQKIDKQFDIIIFSISTNHE